MLTTCNTPLSTFLNRNKQSDRPAFACGTLLDNNFYKSDSKRSLCIYFLTLFSKAKKVFIKIITARVSNKVHPDVKLASGSGTDQTALLQMTQLKICMPSFSHHVTSALRSSERHTDRRRFIDQERFRHLPDIEVVLDTSYHVTEKRVN